ncbi:hypothetical protein Ga0074812_1439 [Parafrankia irregularis]|uniref:Uncharacterized protein n=1 Tax=Parafrankia irregularis TaxID=795642 RepID=A0A0S4QY78_9ACTN|nr:hypothetical protein Ga0074812_1439 [Parafrankia irregularis]
MAPDQVSAAVARRGTGEHVLTGLFLTRKDVSSARQVTFIDP